MVNDTGKIVHTFAVLAHKQSPYLEECILSLKNQTVKSNIFISTAKSSRYVEMIAKKFSIPIIQNTGSSGIASDWSFPFNNCNTQYLTLAHQDDLYLPQYTEYCLASAFKYKKNLIIFTDYSELRGNKFKCWGLNFFIKKMMLITFLFKENIESALLKKISLVFGSPIPCPSVMFNQDNIGNFSFSDKFCCNMDWDAWLRLAQREGDFVYVKKRLMAHRIHKDSQTSLQIENKVRKEEELRIFKSLWPEPIAKILSSFYYIGTKSNS